MLRGRAAPPLLSQQLDFNLYAVFTLAWLYVFVVVTWRVTQAYYELIDTKPAYGTKPYWID